jgi:hypothetical protein
MAVSVRDLIKLKHATSNMVYLLSLESNLSMTQT